MATMKLDDKEISILNKANGEFVQFGSTAQKCPRCGKPLVYQIVGTKEITRCADGKCIMIMSVGI